MADHFSEVRFHLGREVGFDFIDIAELGEGPATVGGEVVHTGDPVGFHGGGLFLRVLTTVAFNFHDKVEQVVRAVAVFHEDNEVREVAAGFRAVTVRDFQAEVVILDVGADLRMAFGHAAELGLPVAVEDDPVEVAFRRWPLGVPAVGFRGVETDVLGGPGGIVGIEQGFDGPGVGECLGDAGGDLVAGQVRELLIHEQGRIGVALADEAGVQPFLGDALELAEEMQLGFLAGVAPLGVKQALGEVEEQRGRAHVAEVFQAHVRRFSDDSGILGDGRSDQLGTEDQGGVVVELRAEAFLWEFDAVAFHAGKADFQGVALRTDGFDLDRFARRLWRRDDGLGGEIEGNAENVGVFDVEEALLVEFVGLATQGAADDLLAQELGAEGADAEHVRDVVGIPTFREHGNGNDAADIRPELAGFPDGVHDLAEEFLIGDVLDGTDVAAALVHFPAEAFDFIGGHAAEVFIEGVAGFELFAVDQQGIWSRKWLEVFVVIPK